MRSRLLSRGLAPTIGLLASAGGGEATAGSIPTALAVATVRGALIYATGESIGGAVPASAVALAERGLKMMSLTRWNAVAFTLLAIGGGTAGVVAFAQPRQAADQGEARPPGAARRPCGPRMIEHGIPRPPRGSRRPDLAVNALMDRLMQNMPDDKASKFRLFDAIPTWSRRLMEDRLVWPRPRPRLAAMREHRDRMKKLETLYTELMQGESGHLWSTDVLNVKYHRLEADQLLAEAGVDAGEPTTPANSEPKPAAAPRR